jgi:NAD-dependent dihydropyrimidine dehydrogenase PreA subunit
VACTACARCALDAPGDLIKMVNNLPVVDYSKMHKTKVPIQRCPTGAIVWIDEGDAMIKGEQAKKILRKSQRFAAPS